MTVAYEAVKQKAAKFSLERSEKGREIADGYPDPGDSALRGACELDFRLFCDSYFAAAFPMAWSDDHLKVIARMQEVILHGGLFALAMPRGAGKTTLAVRAAMWALLYGHRRFVSLIAATEDHSKRLLAHFKTELTYNDALARDFRQVCYPIKRLENNGRKSIGQLFEGQQTRITWGEDRLTLPIMPDSACDGRNVGGSAITVSGLTGSLRGQSATLPSGEIVRPELVLLDDPQTRDSAMSLSQSASREAIIRGDVLGMAGPGKRIAALMACTVIRKDDMADAMLDRKKSPEWSGQKTKMVYAFPTDEKLWEEYRRIRAEGFEMGLGAAKSTEFYASNRAAMDAGAVVAWEARKYDDEISAVQHAMNIRLFNEAAFWAEYQNEPQVHQDIGPDDLVADQVASKLNRIPRGEVPVGCTRLTAFVDVHADVHYWAVCGWEDDFGGYVLDYGTFPEQDRAYFAKREARFTLEGLLSGAGVEEQVYAGLEGACEAILAREWPRDDGVALKVERCLVDANWGPQTDTVYKFCRQGAHSAVTTPSHGKYIGASGKPMREWQRKPGNRIGFNWFMGGGARREVRKVIFDSNAWKTFVLSRLSVPMGGRGCLSLFGSKASDHRLFADHLTSEYRTRTEGRGRHVDEWKLRPERPDNHWFDCLVGCAVAASVQGAELAEVSIGPAPKREQVSFSEMQRLARLARR